MSFLVSGIHTGIGKTICSAILCEALGLDYWKPVQAGDLDNSDSHCVKRLTTNTNIFPEKYRLEIPASPHHAAKEQNIDIKLSDFETPLSNNGIIVETAGGLLSPLSDTISNMDLMKHLQLPNILVSNNYLGSINHTMLSLQCLQKADINTVGIIFSGDNVPSTREYILNHTDIPVLGSIPYFSSVSAELIQLFALKFKEVLKEKLYAK